MKQIQKADPAARKRALTIILVGGVIGTLMIGAYRHYEVEIFAWLEHNIAWLADSPGIVLGFGCLLVAPLLVLSGFLFFYGRRAARAKRIPPPDSAVVRDTVVKTGARAVFHGRFVQVLSVLLLLSGAAIPFLFWYLLDRLIGPT